MKNSLQLLIKTILIITTLMLSGANYAQTKEKITITGKVTVKDTGKPPIGIITVIEKGVADYLVDGNEIGTNRHTFVEKDGTFKFTINKGGTIIIDDGNNRYGTVTTSKLYKTQTMNIVLSPTVRKSSPYPANQLTDFEKKIDIHKRIKISGKITFPDGKPMKDATIAQQDVFTERVPLSAHVFSDNKGEYSYTVLKGGRILIGAMGYEMLNFTATKDTVINVKMKSVNPFK